MLCIGSRVANFAFLKPDLKILAFLNTFAVFQSERLDSIKTLSELHIHYILLLTRVYDLAGCTEYCKNFAVALKMIDAFDKKQMYDRVIIGKKMLVKIGDCIILMFLMSFNVYFVFGHACFICKSRKLLSGFFLTRSSFLR